MGRRELLLHTWSKERRNCNLGLCPAFKFTSQDVEYLEKAGKLLRSSEDMTVEGVMAELGVPSGTCLVTEREVVVNSGCRVGDDDFVNYIFSCEK